MKTLLIIAAFIANSLAVHSQEICPTSFKVNNGNGTCGGSGELRLVFANGCPEIPPVIDSVYINGVKTVINFSAPDDSKCGGNSGYISYCIISGNVPIIDVWTVFFKNSNGGAYTCTVLSASQSVTPVKFVSFDGVVSGNTVTCKWSTEEEINNDHFELQRSFDGTNFSTIALVFGKGTEKTLRNSYQFTDKAASLQSKDVVYYRVKQVDVGGKFSYSYTILVKLGSDNNNINIQVSPNPFADNLTLKFEATEKGVAEIRIINFNGQAILTKNAIVEKGIINLTVDNLTGLVKGVYVVQVSINGIIVGNQKIVKN